VESSQPHEERVLENVEWMRGYLGWENRSLLLRQRCQTRNGKGKRNRNRLVRKRIRRFQAGYIHRPQGNKNVYELLRRDKNICIDKSLERGAAIKYNKDYHNYPDYNLYL